MSEIVQFKNGNYGIRREWKVFGVVFARWYYLCWARSWSPGFVFIDPSCGYRNKEVVVEAWNYLHNPKGRPSKDYGTPTMPTAENP